jgi:hypothetical protein
LPISTATPEHFPQSGSGYLPGGAGLPHRPDTDETDLHGLLLFKLTECGKQERATDMRIPSWVVAASLPAALPFGWGLGVIAAHLMAGHDFGQLLALTVPLCIVAAVAFALSPLLTPGKRLAILSIGTGL